MSAIERKEDRTSSGSMSDKHGQNNGHGWTGKNKCGRRRQWQASESERV
jgi:hypothetical protein